MYTGTPWKLWAQKQRDLGERYDRHTDGNTWRQTDRQTDG